MAATYDQLLPTPKDRIRAMLGDTAVTPGTTTIPAADALVSDEHIAAVLAEEGGFELAVAFLADELVTRFAQAPVSVSSAGESVNFSARIPAWQALAERMRAKAAAGGGAGGTPPRPRATTRAATFTRDMP